MLGAIIGDIVGSRFVFNNIKSKDFEFFTYDCEYTDDTVMTLAIAMAVVSGNKNYELTSNFAVKYMQSFGRKYPDAGYGGRFRDWLDINEPKPYNSYGNGSAMRVSACAWAANSLEEAIELSKAVTKVTHNHPEGMKGAEATAVAIYLAIKGKSKEEIKKYISDNYYEELKDKNFIIDKIRPSYYFNESCQETVPQALEAFFESKSYVDAIRNGISLGGDSDTIGAITGAVAEAYYGIPEEIKAEALTYLDNDLNEVLIFCQKKLGIKL